MGRRFRRNEDWCPECGHLLPQKRWNCQFCGWSLSETQRAALKGQTTDAYEREGLFHSNYTDDVDRFIEKLHKDSLNPSR